MSPDYTSEQILQQLDDCARDFTFPMLDNGHVYLGTTRLTAYRDPQRWALVIEVVGFNPRTGDHDGIDDALHPFGNCLAGPAGLTNDDFLRVTSDGPEGLTFAENGWDISPEAHSIRIRNELVPLWLTPEALAEKRIELAEPPQVTGANLLRSLLPEYRDRLLATEQELRRRILPDLPQILRLEEWHHPDLAGDELPSQSPTFQMIADVLVTGDVSRYDPIGPPNTHWKNWPKSGSL